MKSQKSILLFLVLPVITALALIGLTGCTITINGPELALGEPPAERPPDEGPPPDEVQIAFTADRTDLQPGECAILEWSVEGGFGVELNGQPVERSGQMQVCPEETTPYWLGVDTGETMEEREVVIIVEGAGEPPPEGEGPVLSKVEGVEFINLMVEPDVIPAGGCAMLFWEVMPPGDWPVFLDGQEVPPVGEQEVCPGDTTTYELLVEAPGGPQERMVTLHIEGEPEPEHPPEGEGVEFINLAVEPDVIPPGECAILHWEVMPPGEWLVLLNGQEVPPVGEQEVCPGDTTTYELLVEAPGGPQERMVTLHIEGEPEPEPPPEPSPASPAGPTPAPAPPAGPTPPPAPPAGPTPPPGVVIDFWVDNNNIAAGTCTTLRWHVAHANAVHLDGVGVVGDGSKQICPGSTTVYVLHVAHDAGATEKKVTVKVSGSSSTPTPTPGGTPSFRADLAVTDLYPDNQPKGKVYARITNHGPDSLTNASVQLSCSLERTEYIGGAKIAAVSLNTLTVSLNPGQTKAFDTGFSVETTKYWYKVTCSPQVSFKDPNTANDSYTETIPPPP